MLLALLVGLGAAAGLDAKPTQVTAANLEEELERLRGLGYANIALVAEDEGAEAVVNGLSERATAKVDDASCVLRVSSGDDALLAWLSGACADDNLALSTTTTSLFQRVEVGSIAEPPPQVFAPLQPQATGLQHPKRSKFGTKLLLVSGGILGASYAWYQIDDKVIGNTSDAEWGAMVGLNTLGWVGIAGGGAAIVSARF
jgi:hypothetical protein